MKFMFVNWAFANHGSAQDLHNYTKVAKKLGHEVALFGPPKKNAAFNYSLDLSSADAVIFIFEFTTRLDYGEKMGFLRMLGRVPKERRIVIDCDGKYNEAISVIGDINHEDAEASRRWIETCNSLSDKIFQPTFHPLQPNVKPFFFHAYNPDWEQPLDFSLKPYGMMYVGNNWFRWRPMQRVLEAVAPIRDEVGRMGIVGNGWNGDGDWGGPSSSDDAYFTDTNYLRELNIEVKPSVRFDRVIDVMSEGLFSPVIYRPLFDRLRLVTCRTFETLAANTIPLFGQDENYIEEIYGKAGLELMLPDDAPKAKILDIMRRPKYYAEIVGHIRKHLAAEYSYAARVQELVELVNA